MQNYVQKADVVDLVAPYNVSSGGGAKVGSIFGVALTTLTSGASGGFVIRGRVNGIPTNSGETWTQGEIIYWDDSNKWLTSSSSGNLKVGFAAAAKGSLVLFGDIVLNGTV